MAPSSFPSTRIAPSQWYAKTGTWTRSPESDSDLRSGGSLRVAIGEHRIVRMWPDLRKVERVFVHAFLQSTQRVILCLRSHGRFTRDGPADPEPRHLVEQRGARQTKLCGRTFHAAHLPTTVFKRTQD